MIHEVYVRNHARPGETPSWRARCRDCDRYSSMYWHPTEAYNALAGHGDYEEYGDVPEPNEDGEYDSW